MLERSILLQAFLSLLWCGSSSLCLAALAFFVFFFGLLVDWTSRMSTVGLSLFMYTDTHTHDKNKQKKNNSRSQRHRGSALDA